MAASVAALSSGDMYKGVANLHATDIAMSVAANVAALSSE